MLLMSGAIRKATRLSKRKESAFVSQITTMNKFEYQSDFKSELRQRKFDRWFLIIILSVMAGWLIPFGIDIITHLK